jgi:Fur family ferric uptake transcriptional regulator
MAVKKQALKIDRKALSSAGLRMTRQRALILEIIRHGHLDADEVYRQAREKQPRFSLSTVYRTLRMLKEQDLVDELHFGEAHHHYEVKPPAEHHHLVCLGCGKIVEFECQLCPEMKKEIARKKGFEVTGVEVHMTGYCSKCRQGRE